MVLLTQTDNVTLADYFRERLHVSSEQLDPPPHEDTRWYVGGMLARFGDTNQLYSYEGGTMTIRSLAMLYKDAHEAGSARERCLILRQLGDLALFMGALFPENYARRGIHQDYFIGMGGGAYDYLSENAPQNRHIFSELAAAFTRMLALIADACSRQRVFDAADVLQLYQRWRQSRDHRLEQQLRALGIDLSGGDGVH